MLRPLDSQEKPAKRTYDVCVIGAGAAGITVAMDLASKGCSVFLAEGGGLQATATSQNQYAGNVIGDPYFDLRGTRLRYFGGTTATWGGLCRELDPHDLDPRLPYPLPRWPIQHEDMLRFSARASAILQVPRQAPDRVLNSDVNEIFFEFSPPVKFGLEFRKKIASSSNIDAFINCNFLGFQYNGASIVSAEFSNYSGVKSTVKAKCFVLACGGIENSRIMLIENRAFDNKLGNQNNLVGRYWSEHNHFTIGDFFLFDNGAFHTKARVSSSGAESIRIFVGPSRQFLEQNRVLNSGLRLLPLYQRTGAKRVLTDLLCTTPELSNALLEPFGERLYCAGKIRAAWEQIPDIDNRIALSATRDKFGLQRCNLYWRKTWRDKVAPLKAAQALGNYLAQNDLGRIKLAPWLLKDDDDFPDDDEIGGNHHMGGTRMAETERYGVVDPNCRVFGTSNLYIGGSSVFPSCGHANPTYAIVQLALRLADHLAEVLQTRH